MHKEDKCTKNGSSRIIANMVRRYEIFLNVAAII